MANLAAPALDLDCTAGVLPAGVTFTRTTLAWVYGSDGVLTTVPHNFLVNSEAFDSWTKTNVTVSSDVENSPLSGAATADKLVETAISAVHEVVQSIAVVSGNTYTFSVYAKAAERSILRLVGSSAFFGASNQAWFNLGTGSLGTVQGATTATITSIGSGWYRCSYTRTATASGGAGFFIGTANTDGALSFLGVVGSGLYIWGAQLEQNIGARDYNRTTSSAFYGPAFEWDPSTLRTNLLTASNDFSTGAGWTMNGVPTTATVDPFGGRAASALTIVQVTDVCYRVVTVTPSTTYTFSYFVKLGDKAANRYAIYDHTNNAFIVGSAIAVGASTSGWVRVSVPFTTPSTCTQARLYNERANTGETGTNYFYGAMLELGGNSTEYIPTTTTTASAGPVAARGLRVEESRTNLIPFSGGLTQTGWGATATRTANQAVAPDGTLSATLLNDTDAASQQYCDTVLTITSDSNWYTWSMHVRANTSPACSIRTYILGGTTPLSGGNGFNFTFATRAISGISGATASDCGYVDIGGGWFRLWVRIQNNGTGNISLYGRTFPCGGASSLTGSIFAWGGQLELGPFMSSYIHCTGSSLTRAADIPPLAVGSWFNAVEGTLVADYQVPFQNLTAATGVIWGFSDGTFNQSIYLSTPSGSDNFNVVDGNVGQANQTIASPPLTPKRLAGAYKANDFTMARNGVAIGTDTAGTVPVVSNAAIGKAPWANANYVNGYARRIRYFDSRLTSGELQTVTTAVAVPDPQIVYAGITTLGEPALGQVHVVAAVVPNITAPTLGTPALAQPHTLSGAVGAVTGAPVLATPVVGQKHAVGAVGGVTGPIPLDNPILAQTHALTAPGAVAGAVALGRPRLRAAIAVAASRVGAVAASSRAYFQPRIGH